MDFYLWNNFAISSHKCLSQALVHIYHKTVSQLGFCFKQILVVKYLCTIQESPVQNNKIFLLGRKIFNSFIHSRFVIHIHGQQADWNGLSYSTI